MMHLLSIASAFPEESLSQRACYERMESSGVLERLRPGSQHLLKKLLLNDNGIETRRLAFPDIGFLGGASAEDLNRGYEQEAPRLAGEAVRKALDEAGVRGEELDALFVCSCTGYLCPGISSYVAEAIGLGEDTYLNDLVGHGCGAALPMLNAASGFCHAHENATVACVAVEVCSAAFYVDDDPGVLVSLALFGDGAAATIWRSGSQQGHYHCGDFDRLHWPEFRETLRFSNASGFLKNQLHRSVPQTASRAVGKLYAKLNGFGPGRIISHSGGRDVLDHLEAALGRHELTEARTVLRQFGNTSSPSVLLALEAHLNGEATEDRLWLVSFGAGFSCHSLQLSRNGL